MSRSGGMSNELNNIIANVTNGVLEGVAIGGDRYVSSIVVVVSLCIILFSLHRYPSSTFVDHIQRFHDDPAVKMIVLLGEVNYYGGGGRWRILKYRHCPSSPTSDWGCGGVRSVLADQIREAVQAHGSLVHWNLRQDVCFRGAVWSRGSTCRC